MTVGNRVSSIKWIGISTDTKPTSPATGSTFFETDTGLDYYYNGAAWALITEKAVSETLTNKTLTAPVISTISNSGTITIPTGTDTLVGKATSDVLTNKTLTSPIISSISNTGTITLPTATTTLVGKDTTDILTNKSIDATTNPLTNIHINPFSGKKTGAFFPRAATPGVTGILNPFVSAITGVGSGVETTVVNDANGMGSLCDTAATSSSIAGFKCITNTYRKYNPMVMFRFLLNAATSFRLFIGLSSGASSNPASSADYLANLSGVGLWVDQAVSNNWKIMHNSGGASSTVDDTSTGFDANVHTLKITANDGTPNFVVQLDGVTMTNGTVTTAIPATGTIMGPIAFIDNVSSAASKTFNYYKMWMEADL